MTSPGCAHGRSEDAQHRLENRVIADVGERGEVTLLVAEPGDGAQRVEGLEPHRLVGRPLPLHRQVHRAGDVAQVEAAAARPVGPRLLGHRRRFRRGGAGLRVEVGGGSGQVLRAGDAPGPAQGGIAGGGLEGPAGLARGKASQADVDRLAVLVAADLAGTVAAPVPQQFHLIADQRADVGRTQEVAVHRVQRLAVGHRAHGRRRGLRDQVAAVRLRPRARLGDRGEGELEVLGLGRLQGHRRGEDRRRSGRGGRLHRSSQSRSSASSTSGRLTTMFSGVRVVIQTSGLVRDKLHSTCGMNGGTNTQSPSSMSR